MFTFISRSLVYPIVIARSEQLVYLFAVFESLFIALVVLRCHAIRITLYINAISTLTAHSNISIYYYFCDSDSISIPRFLDFDFEFADTTFWRRVC